MWIGRIQESLVWEEIANEMTEPPQNRADHYEPWMFEQSVKRLKSDPTVIWIDEVRYRLASDPPYVTRSIEQIKVPERYRAEENRVSARIPETQYGPRGGRYTEDITKEGRRYRRYF